MSKGDRAPEAQIGRPARPDFPLILHVHRRAPDLRALHDTQRLLFRRSLALGLGIFFTLLPFSFYGNEHGVHFIFMEGGPISLVLPWLGAIAWWITFFHARSKLKVAGF